MRRGNFYYEGPTQPEAHLIDAGDTIRDTIGFSLGLGLTLILRE